MKDKINIGRISNWLMNIGIMLSVISLYLTYNVRKSLPEGVCPINNNERLITIAITISLCGVILSFFGKEKSKDIQEN